jgi:hypothetical protein
MKKVTKRARHASDDERKDCASDEVKAYQSADSEEHADKDILRPSAEKVGEGPGNLRHREKWFQQRTTGSSRK